MKNIKIVTVTILLLVLAFYANEAFAKSFLKPVISVNGKIFNEINKVGIGLDIYVLNETGKIVSYSKSNKTDGGYFLTGLKPGTAYTLVFKLDGFTVKKMEIATPIVDKYLELEQDFSLKLYNNSFSDFE